jgi:hypothetical protein
LHEPPVQLSARVGSHAVHEPPPPPHAESEGVLQVLPEQQPDVQVAAQLVQTPAVQLPLVHAAQAAPPDPQAPRRLPG